MGSIFLVVLLGAQFLLFLFLLWFVARSRQEAPRALASAFSEWRQDVAGRFERLEREWRGEMSGNRKEAAEQAAREREERAQAQGVFFQNLNQSLGQSLDRLGQTQSLRLQAFSEELFRFSRGQDERFEQLKGAVEARLLALQTENASKLEEMRSTVDEKLHATLEKRLGDSFKLVSERLEEVHRGLGEMQNLAVGVGDLKKVLSNVKTRGSWGEVQLSNLLEQMLAPSQYAANVATVPGSADRVEFALRFPGPGREEGKNTWLPIDAKFPLEDYQRLLEAQDRGDRDAVEEAGKGLETRLKQEARRIREKYIAPPDTLDFALLYLPIEGLYAEALRRPGLADTLQREWRICLAGPTTLAAMLNSFQMGFRTLAIEKRSAEVWAVLGAVKSEFSKFGEALAHTKKKLQEASNSIDSAEVRTRAMTRRLKDVEILPQAAIARQDSAAALLSFADTEADGAGE